MLHSRLRMFEANSTSLIRRILAVVPINVRTSYLARPLLFLRQVSLCLS